MSAEDEYVPVTDDDIKELKADIAEFADSYYSSDSSYAAGYRDGLRRLRLFVDRWWDRRRPRGAKPSSVQPPEGPPTPDRLDDDGADLEDRT